MHFSSFLLNFVMLTNACICSAKSYQSDQPYKQPFERIHEKEQETPNKNEIIARLNDTLPEELVDVIQKEPKFFDEFECKY